MGSTESCVTAWEPSSDLHPQSPVKQIQNISLQDAMQLTFWFVLHIFGIVQLTEVSSNPCENNTRPRLILSVRSGPVLQVTGLSYSLNRQACIRDQTGEQEGSGVSSEPGKHTR